MLALAAPCHSQFTQYRIAPAFFASGSVFARKWTHRLPFGPCRVSRSSIPAARFTFSAMPGNGRNRLLSRRDAFVGSYRKPLS